MMRRENPEIPGQTGQTRELISPGLTGLTWNFIRIIRAIRG